MTERTPEEQAAYDARIREVVDAAPPLKPEQIDRLRHLLGYALRPAARESKGNRC